MSVFTLAISCLTTCNLPWFWTWHSRFLCNIALYSIGPCFCHQLHWQVGVVLLWLHPFVLSGVISPLISSSILGTYRTGELIFQCPIFLPFRTVPGVLKEGILKWFAIPCKKKKKTLSKIEKKITFFIIGTYACLVEQSYTSYF